MTNKYRLKIGFLTAVAIAVILYVVIYNGEWFQRGKKHVAAHLFQEFCSDFGKTKTGLTDLTEDFDVLETNSDDSFNVFEALRNDGYNLTYMSMNHTVGDTQRVSRRKETVNHRRRSLQVPNVVHYVFIGPIVNFTFFCYLSYLSVHKHLKPDQIFVHGDHIPTGRWWNRTIAEVNNIYHVYTPFTDKAINGLPYKYPNDITNYLRARILLNYGGIYIDADVLVVKSFTPLRQYPFVIGREHPSGLCNGIMIARRGAPFVRLLLEQYRGYLGEGEVFPVKGVLNPHTLAAIYPHLVHVEEATLNKPSWYEAGKLYDGSYNFTENYAIHLWLRLWPQRKIPMDIVDVIDKNTTIGELVRHILHDPN